MFGASGGGLQEALKQNAKDRRASSSSVTTEVS